MSAPVSTPVQTKLLVGELPGQEAMTSQDAFKVARLYIAEMNLANAAYNAAALTAPGEAAQWGAMEAFDTAANALLGLIIMLEKRAVLADIEAFLEAVYGRV
jgi:hypothetical protein